MKTFPTLVALLILNVASLSAQVTLAWEEAYASCCNEAVNALAVDASGNVYVTGIAEGSATFHPDIFTIKYNSAGVRQWRQYYTPSGVDGDDVPYAIAVDGSGNVYVTGESTGSNFNTDLIVIKYNVSGSQVWLKRFAGTGGEPNAGHAITVDGSGNVYVAGYSTGTGTEHDFTTIKFNSSGVQQWAKVYNGPANTFDEANSIAVDGSGNVYVTGYRSDTTHHDFVTIKYNSAGDQQWIQLYPAAFSSDEATALAIDNAGNVYVTGKAAGNYATVKYSTAGTEEWAKMYYSGAASDIALDGLGNVYVTGTGSGGYPTVKYDSAGNEIWVRKYNGDINYTPSLAIDGSGNVYVAGDSSGDYATIKYNSLGVQQWVQLYGQRDGNGYTTGENAASMALDALGNIYVTGITTNSGDIYNYDIATIRYSQVPASLLPIAPTNLNLAVAKMPNSNILLTWTDNSNNEDGFKIYRNLNGITGWETVATVGANISNYLDQGLDVNTKYYYKVASFNTYGTSSYSDTLNLTTIPTGIDDIDNHYRKITICQSASSGAVVIKAKNLNGKPVRFTYYNAVGELTGVNQISNESTTLNISLLPPGIYCYTAEWENTYEKGKFFVIK